MPDWPIDPGGATSPKKTGRPSADLGAAAGAAEMAGAACLGPAAESAADVLRALAAVVKVA